MFDKPLGRRRALAMLPAIGGGLALSSIKSLEGSHAIDGPCARPVELLRLRPPREWDRAALVSFGQSGYDLIVRRAPSGIEWAGDVYLALTLGETSRLPGTIRPEEIGNSEDNESALSRPGQSLILLIGDLLDESHRSAAQSVARAAHKAGHVVVVIPAIPQEQRVTRHDIVEAFGRYACCILVSSASGMEPADADRTLRSLLLGIDLSPFAIALQNWRAPAIAARLAAKPGLYATAESMGQWDRKARSGPDVMTLARSCFGARAPELLCFSVDPAPPRKIKSTIVRTAHRVVAPAKPLIAIKGGYYNPWGTYCLTMHALMKVD
jgi:hypothetical protein